MTHSRQEAENIVEVFIPYTDAVNERGFAIKCAITHVEGILKELESINHKPEYVSFSYTNDDGEFQNAYERQDYWKYIIKELKQM